MKKTSEADFLKAIGWPDSAAEMDGVLSRSAPSGEMESTVAIAVRSGDEIVLSVNRIGLEGVLERVMEASAKVSGGEVSALVAKAGDPPEEMLPEDAAELFGFLASGLGRPSFSPTGEHKRKSARKMA